MHAARDQYYYERRRPYRRPKEANDIVATGKVDLVALARAMLADPRWPWRAAKAFGEPVQIVPQYKLSEAHLK